MLHPDDVKDAVKVLEVGGSICWRKADGSHAATDANLRPLLPQGLADMFWAAPIEAQK